MTLFDQMLARYEIKTGEQKRGATHEVMQEIALAGLYRGGFFDKAAFYGGTCLRFFTACPGSPRIWIFRLSKRIAILIWKVIFLLWSMSLEPPGAMW